MPSRERWAEWLPLIQDFVAGKDLQYRDKNGWHKCNSLSGVMHADRNGYRTVSNPAITEYESWGHEPQLDVKDSK